tara:strand:+ start:653 stop:1999 length:1347 start_codon:yes stop_codon:yes gene_type:complete
MGFFKKIFKGIGKVFKKIGKGIKSAFKKFGKFMGKIGILGQVAMMFILPGVGQLLGKAWSAIAGQTATQATASAAGQATSTAAAEAGKTAAQATAEGVAKESATKAAIKAGTEIATKKATGLMAKEGLAKGIGHVMQFTNTVVGTPGRVFSNITQGVTETLGNFAKTASNNIFGTNFTTAAGETLSGKFFGAGDSALPSESAFGRSFGKTSKFQNLAAKAPTAQTLDAVDSYQETLDALNKNASFKPFDANDINLTASTDLKGGVVADSKAQQLYNETSVTATTSEQSLLNKATKPEMNMKDLGTPPIIDPASVKSENIFTRLADTPKTAYESLLNAPKSMLEKVETFAADPIGQTGELLFGGTKKSIQAGVDNQLLQGLGLIEKPVAPVYETTNTYVAPFEMTTPQMFEAPETMNAMSFAQNVTSSPSPYGYTAFQYNQYMNRTAAA